ncbi:uncharacterized protein LOC131147124 [Malania oleifera]|uniref:uncharacterized protein LOC131147124 n=1 Tax=Malania oleifera TaxID=397392 RepID=UPI0025AE6DD8|nr:uncharacterized protein LOC131147124 [Malania oleifera]
MGSFSDIGLGLSAVFGCLLLGLVAELYYLVWWKRRIANTEINEEEDDDDDGHSNYAKELLHLLCWKKPSFANSSDTLEINPSVGNPIAINGHEQGHEPDPELGCAKDLLLQNFGEESVEAELMRLHNLAGPPRFLFTINEETKEDLESDDGKSRGDRSRKGSRTRSLSDVIVAVETPFMTPLSSPPKKLPPLNLLDSYNHHGFNPLFESSTEAELSSLRSSPPPKFKFLRDAEEKLYRRLLQEAERRRALKNGGSVQDHGIKAPTKPNSSMGTEESDGSLVAVIVGKNKEREIHHHHLPQYHSGSSQVLPLASSPSTFIPPC